MEVVQLQDALKQLGFNCGTSDGIFGPKTEQALKDFQATDRSLTISGVLDQPTREFLVEILKSK
nr:peptidoglycan-binding domain-containing protein [Gramella sp. KN1008]